MNGWTVTYRSRRYGDLTIFEYRDEYWDTDEHTSFDAVCTHARLLYETGAGTEIHIARSTTLEDGARLTTRLAYVDKS